MNKIIVKWKQIYTEGITLSTRTKIKAVLFWRRSSHNRWFTG